MELLVEGGVRHLLVDLPSVDREDDQGFLSAHSVFFGVPARQRTDPNKPPAARSATEVDSKREGCTVTELCYFDEHVPDGLYTLNLQVSPLLLDAIPSRPILFPTNPLGFRF